MEYVKTKREYTEKKLPEVWSKAVEAEKTAELLVYRMMSLCMESFSDIELEIDAKNPVGLVLRSWTRNTDIGFGSNAITLKNREDGTLVLGCVYDIWKLKEDTEVMMDLFGTLNPDTVGEKVIDRDITIPQEKMDALFAGIQKVKTPLEKK